jgi:hypothetical protein
MVIGDWLLAGVCLAAVGFAAWAWMDLRWWCHLEEDDDDV